MTARRQDIPATVKREAAQRTEGVRSPGTEAPATLRSPMVRGVTARRGAILAALERERLIPSQDSLAD